MPSCGYVEYSSSASGGRGTGAHTDTVLSRACDRSCPRRGCGQHISWVPDAPHAALPGCCDPGCAHAPLRALDRGVSGMSRGCGRARDHDAAGVQGGAIRLPIVAMRANAHKEDIDRAFAAGMSGRLSKTIDIDAVKRILQDLPLPRAASQ